MHRGIIRYFPDRPVGPTGDTLWSDDDFRAQLGHIVDVIVSPLVEPTLRDVDSMTFAIYGNWGMGKSSALKIIEEDARNRAAEKGALDRLHVCRYAAPQHEHSARDVRTTLAMRMMTGIAGTPGDAVDRFLKHARAVAKDADGVVPEGGVSATTEVTRTAKVLEEIATTLVGLADFEQVIARELRATARAPRPVTDEVPSSRNVGRGGGVLLVLIDDLDRCKPEFIWQVLNAIQQWSDVSNIFFVLAIALEALRNSVDAHGARGDDPTHDYALEKYVQHAVHVPPIDEIKLERFIRALVAEYGADDALGRIVGENTDLLYIGLRQKTPRSIKRFLNYLRPALSRRMGSLEAKEERAVLKEKIISYAWPAFARYMDLTRRDDEPYAVDLRNTLATIELHCASAEKTQDELLLNFSVKRAVDGFNATVQQVGGGLDLAALERELLSLLATHPPLFMRPPGDGGGGIDESTDEETPLRRRNTRSKRHEAQERVPAKPSSRLAELYVQAEAAEASGNRREALRRAEQILDLVGQQGDRFSHQDVNLIGNVAVTAEQLEAEELALALYRTALKLDPNHSNNIQNFVDFLVDMERPEFHEETEHWLSVLKTEPHKKHRPERTRILERRFRVSAGSQPSPEPAADDDLKAVLHDFRADPTNERLFVTAMVFLHETGNLDVARQTAREFCRAVTGSPAKLYVGLRGLADMLAASSRSEDEMEAMEMYGFLETHRFRSLGVRDQAAMLHNYATLLAKHGYLEPAMRRWVTAYRFSPSDMSIRKAFSLAMLRHHPAIANAVANGAPLDEGMLPASLHEDEAPLRFLPETADRWWEAFDGEAPEPQPDGAKNA